jgi:arginase
VRPDQIRYRGVRACDAAEVEIISELEIVQEPIGAAAPEGPIYIHLDLDVLNPSEFSHTTYPTLGGPSVNELCEAVYALVETGKVIGIAVTECAV